MFTDITKLIATVPIMIISLRKGIIILIQVGLALVREIIRPILITMVQDKLFTQVLVAVNIILIAVAIRFMFPKDNLVL